MPSRWTAALALLLLVTSGVAGAVDTRGSGAAPDAGDAPCQDPREVPGQGLSCPTGDGRWLVRAGPGTWLPTHGPDPAPAAGGTGSHGSLESRSSPADPTCVGPPHAEPHVRVVYAYSIYRSSNLGYYEDRIRSTVEQANGMLRQAAQASAGAYRNLQVACDADGRIVVEEAVLTTQPGNTDWGSVSNDLRNQGHAQRNEKYWIFVDPHSESVDWGGQSSLRHDDRPTRLNQNNHGETYSVNWGTLSAKIWLHEIMHAMGAVQKGSPNFYDNYGGWHCSDNRDVMCYGPETFLRCDDQHLDCGHDDYFHPDPPPGTYLAEHWNVASEINAFVASSPAPCRGDVEVRASGGTCSAAAGADGGRASYAAASGEGEASAWLAGASGSGPGEGVAAASGSDEARGTAAASGDGPARGWWTAASGEGPATAGDAAGLAAASGTGEARGGHASVAGTGPASGTVAASGTGPADGTAAASVDGPAHGAVAASGTRDASGAVAVAGLGDARGSVGAASLLGEAEGGEAAASGTGTARGWVAASGSNDCGHQACFGVGAQEDSEAWTVAASGTGEARSEGVAASGTGPASGYAAASGSGPAQGVAAVSGAGPAQGSVAVSGTDDADGPVAVSGTGEADGFVAVSGCTTARGLGADAACQNVDPGTLLP